MIKSSKFWQFFLPLTFISICFLVSSCTSTPKEEIQPENQSQETNSVEIETIKLNVPERKKTSFFSSVDPDILENIELGSPESLESATSQLKKKGPSYTEEEKILFSVAAGISRYAWTTQEITWETPEVGQNNAYIGALNSVEKGVYDSSTGENDFLTLVLPSLVLLSNNSRTDYFSSANTALNLAIGLRSDSVIARYLLGVLYRRQQDYSSALEHFKIAYQNAQNCLQVAYAYADALYHVGNTRDSLNIAERLILAYPNNLNILKLCAQTTFALEQYQNAELYVARVLQQNPSDSEYILFRARILVEEGDYIKASSLLDVFSRTNTTSRDYLMLRARIQRDWNKNMRGAVDTIEQALALYPDDPELLLAAAELASDTGESVLGKTSGELASSVLATEPNNEKALEISIKDLIARRRWNEAYSISLRIVGNANASLETIHTHITICLALNKTDEAWRFAQSIYETSPQNEMAVQSYLEVLFALGRRTESENLINNLLTSASSRLKSLLYYRKSFLSSGEQNILADLRSSLISNPRNEDSLFRLYTIYYDKKDYRRAQYYLKQVVALHPSNEDLLRRNEELDLLLSR